MIRLQIAVFVCNIKSSYSQRTSANWVFMWILNVQPCDLRREKSNETAFSNCGYFASVKKNDKNAAKTTTKILLPACNIRLHWFLVRIFISEFICMQMNFGYAFSSVVDCSRYAIPFVIWAMFFFGRVLFLFLVGNRHLHKNFEPTVWLR